MHTFVCSSSYFDDMLSFDELLSSDYLRKELRFKKSNLLMFFPLMIVTLYFIFSSHELFSSFVVFI